MEVLPSLISRLGTDGSMGGFPVLLQVEVSPDRRHQCLRLQTAAERGLDGSDEVVIHVSALQGSRRCSNPGVKPDT